MNTDTNKTFGPYSPVRQVGEFYFISGQVGVDFATKTAEPNARAQTMKALENLDEVLKSAGLTLDHVVKTTLFVTDMGDFAEINDAYVSRFAEPRPARSTVGVKELPRVAGDTPLKIEIEAIAWKAA